MTLQFVIVLPDVNKHNTHFTDSNGLFIYLYAISVDSLKNLPHLSRLFTKQQKSHYVYIVNAMLIGLSHYYSQSKAK